MEAMDVSLYSFISLLSLLLFLNFVNKDALTAESVVFVLEVEADLRLCTNFGVDFYAVDEVEDGILSFFVII